MRNLKRALSLALAAIMLLGMMVMGTSAVSIDDFTDSDAVQNVEAVTLTSGLGIFQGRTDGSCTVLTCPPTTSPGPSSSPTSPPGLRAT